MVQSNKSSDFDIDWENIISTCDINGDNKIDFQEFLAACIDKKVLASAKEIQMAFKMLDVNGDGFISLDDFEDLFNSYGGAHVDRDLWDNLLEEADLNGDGMVSYEEFKYAMMNILSKNI